MFSTGASLGRQSCRSKTSIWHNSGESHRGPIAIRPVALCYPMIMSQPVKLSDNLVLDARLAGQIEERSIAGQVEFWARLGRSVELLLEGQQVLTLYRGVNLHPLSTCLESVDSDAG